MVGKGKKLPHLKTDAEAVNFIDTADLSEYDLGGTWLSFPEFIKQIEAARKTKAISLRLPVELLEAIRRKAAEAGVPYQRAMKASLEKAFLPAETSQDLAKRADRRSGGSLGVGREIVQPVRQDRIVPAKTGLIDSIEDDNGLRRRQRIECSVNVGEGGLIP